MPTKTGDLVVEAAGAFAPLDNRLKEVEKELVEVTNKYSETDDEGEQEAYLDTMAKLEEEKTELLPKVAKAKSKLEILRKREQSEAANATPVPKGPTPLPNMRKDPKADYKPGDLFIKTMLVKGLAHLQQRPETEVLNERYGKDDNVRAAYGIINKTAVPVATTTTTGWAAELVQSDVRGFLDMIRNVSVGAALASRSMALTFDGYGSITIPRINQIAAAGQTEPAWVGEGGVIPLQRFSLGAATINRYKLA
jgi:HK97 family phage major capsid protein